MPAKLIIVIGHSALDRVYRIAAFPPSPTKVRALEHIECGGGTAANAAAAIARLGGNVQLWSRVGNDDTGKGIRQSLKASGVDTEFLLEHEGSRTSTSVIIVDGQGRHLVVSERDHAMPAKIDWLPLENILSAGAILSDMTWREATLAVFRQARSLGIPTVLDLDVAGALPSEEIFEVTDYGICSEAALERFVDGQDLRERLASLISKGIRHAGVTLGEGGTPGCAAAAFCVISPHTIRGSLIPRGPATPSMALSPGHLPAGWRTPNVPGSPQPFRP